MGYIGIAIIAAFAHGLEFELDTIMNKVLEMVFFFLLERDTASF